MRIGYVLSSALAVAACASAPPPPAAAAAHASRELVIAYDDARATGTVAFPSTTY